MIIFCGFFLCHFGFNLVVFGSYYSLAGSTVRIAKFSFEVKPINGNNFEFCIVIILHALYDLLMNIESSIFLFFKVKNSVSYLLW